MKSKTLPILYSFRRCPYAMRARLAISVSGLGCEHREILLKNKPPHMTEVSPKGTVPVLIANDNQVIDESIDIMYWALKQNDPNNWLAPDYKSEIDDLIKRNDNQFKTSLDKYKYFERFPEKPQQFYRSECEVFIKSLEDLLSKNKYLMRDTLSLADMATFTFVRQFAHSDKGWFFSSDYKKTIAWLNELTETEIFKIIMEKHPLYKF